MFAIIDGEKHEVWQAYSCGPGELFHRIELNSQRDTGCMFQRLPDGTWEHCTPYGGGRYLTRPADVRLEYERARLYPVAGGFICFDQTDGEIVGTGSTADEAFQAAQKTYDMGDHYGTCAATAALMNAWTSKRDIRWRETWNGQELVADVL